MIADEITRTIQTLEERGIPNDSFFTLTFDDGSQITEKETNWSWIAEEKPVLSLGRKKLVKVCKMPVQAISVVLGGLSAQIDVPEGYQVYQSIKAEAIIIPDIMRKDKIIGRTIGIVKDGEVIEEKYIDLILNTVTGWRK